MKALMVRLHIHMFEVHKSHVVICTTKFLYVALLPQRSSHAWQCGVNVTSNQ